LDLQTSKPEFKASKIIINRKVSQSRMLKKMVGGFLGSTKITLHKEVATRPAFNT
jgi:hypothetical protein